MLPFGLIATNLGPGTDDASAPVGFSFDIRTTKRSSPIRLWTRVAKELTSFGQCFYNLDPPCRLA
jgi:hypothetical protein